MVMSAISFSQNAQGVGDRNIALERRIDVDVIDASTEIGDKPKIWPRPFSRIYAAPEPNRSLDGTSAAGDKVCVPCAAP
jgi:hypothetical protein